MNWNQHIGRQVASVDYEGPLGERTYTPPPRCTLVVRDDDAGTRVALINEDGVEIGATPTDKILSVEWAPEPEGVGQCG